MGQVSPGSAIVSGGVTLPGPVLAMISVRPKLDPLRQAISEWASGEYG